MICKKCNKTIDDDSKFCLYCGEKVEIQKEIESSKDEQNSENKISDENISLNKKEISEGEKIKQTTENLISDENISSETKKVSEKENIKTFSDFFYSHHGSIGRKEFLFRGFIPLTMLLIFLIAIPNISLSIFTTYFQIKGETIAPIGFFKFLNYFVIALSFFLFVIISNISVKRLHDTNSNGWWAMLNLIPVINFFLLLFLILAPSKKDNIYGIKSDYNLNSRKILLSIFYIFIIFVLLVMNGLSKGITNNNLNERAEKSAKYEEKKQPIQDNAKVVENQQLKEFNDTLALAQQGDVVSQSMVGLKYYFGDLIEYFGNTVQKDYTKAFYWLEKAGNGGSLEAQYSLGVMYSNGEGINQDYKKAIEWFEKAASKDYSEAQYNLGVMYAKGEGVQKDFKKAIEWFEKAASKDYSEAQYNLGVMYAKGEGVQKDFKKAIEWHKKASINGNKEAQFIIGVMYYNGDIEKKDYKKAFELFEKSALNGHSGSELYLGMMYENGNGVKYDVAQAIDWYTKSANKGNIKAQLLLGNMYSGFATKYIGSAEYTYKAKQWFGKACDGGSQVGCDSYKKIIEQGY